MKAWTAIDRLSIRWKSGLSNEIKSNFFLAVVMSILLYVCNHVDADQAYRKKARRELYKNAISTRPLA